MCVLLLDSNPQLLYGGKKFIISFIQLVASSKSRLEVATHDY